MIVSASFQATMASHPLLKLCLPFAQRDSRTAGDGNDFLDRLEAQAPGIPGMEISPPNDADRRTQL